MDRIRINGVSLKGTPFPHISMCEEKEEEEWQGLTLCAEPGESCSIAIYSSANSNKLKYSMNGGKSWSLLTTGSVSFDQICLAYNGYQGNLSSRLFNISGKFSAKGHLSSILYNNFLEEELTREGVSNAFNALFKESSIIDASGLIIPRYIGSRAFNMAFDGCTLLESMPSLDAISVEEGASECFCATFSNCRSLKAPSGNMVKIPGILGDRTYASMFYGCKSLGNITMSFTGINKAGNDCFNLCVYGCNPGKVIFDALSNPGENEISQFTRVNWTWDLDITLLQEKVYAMKEGDRIDFTTISANLLKTKVVLPDGVYWSNDSIVYGSGGYEYGY